MLASAARSRAIGLCEPSGALPQSRPAPRYTLSEIAPGSCAQRLADDLMDRLKCEARRSRRPFKAVVNEAIRLGVDRLNPPVRRAVFRQRAFKMGFPPGTQLDKALQWAAGLEDEEVVQGLPLGK